MRRIIRISLIFGLLAVAWSLTGQQLPPPNTEPKPPFSAEQMEKLLKSEYEKSVKDAGELVKLSEELKAELEKSGRNVLSVSAMRKAEKIEDLAKRIRSRMRRF